MLAAFWRAQFLQEGSSRNWNWNKILFQAQSMRTVLWWYLVLLSEGGRCLLLDVTCLPIKCIYSVLLSKTINFSTIWSAERGCSEWVVFLWGCLRAFCSRDGKDSLCHKRSLRWGMQAFWNQDFFTNTVLRLGNRFWRIWSQPHVSWVEEEEQQLGQPVEAGGHKAEEHVGWAPFCGRHVAGLSSSGKNLGEIRGN